MAAYILILTLLSCASAKTTSVLSKSQCRMLIVNHHASKDVEYKAGVDAKGKPVTPADLPSNNDFDFGKDVVIDLQIPIEKYAPVFPSPSGIPPAHDYINETLQKSQTHIGSITIRKNGETWINGKPIQDQLQQQLATACRQQYPDLN